MFAVQAAIKSAVDSLMQRAQPAQLNDLIFVLGNCCPCGDICTFPVHFPGVGVIDQDAVATARYRLQAALGQHCAVSSEYLGVLRAAGKIIPFVGVFLHVVKLF